MTSRIARLAFAAALALTTAHVSGRQTAPAARGGFELTVDSIMREPKLAGYPPTGLRWSGGPVENHGFEEETSWADEYKRILKLFDDNLKDRRRTA